MEIQKAESTFSLIMQPMDVGRDEGGGGGGGAQGDSSLLSSWGGGKWRFLLRIMIFVFMGFAVRNIFVKDYHTQTRDALTSAGEDPNQIAPMTQKEALKARQQQAAQARELLANVSLLMQERKEILGELSSLKEEVKHLREYEHEHHDNTHGN